MDALKSEIKIIKSIILKMITWIVPEVRQQRYPPQHWDLDEVHLGRPENEAIFVKLLLFINNYICATPIL